MRQFKRIGLETLESRFAPATLAGHTDFDWMTKQQAVPTVPVLGGLASSPLGVAKVQVVCLDPDLDDGI